MLPPAGGTRILGIDPGLRITGYGIIDRVGQALTYVASGRITTDEKTDLPTRLRTILAGLHEVIDQGAPMQVAVEKVFVNVDRFGNTSAASIPIALSDAIEQGRVKEGMTVLFAAFGAGFTWGSLIVRF